jgi:RHS repeat-associated protein
LINTADQVVSTYTYDPWGQPLGTTEQVPQPLRYGAREYDGETGFYYVRARYYDAQLGRFISEDPIGMKGGINPFVYVGNDPVNGRDPNGLCELKQEVWFGYFYADGTFEPVRKIGEFCLGSDGGSGGAWDPAQPQSPDPQRPACTAEALNLIGNAGLDLLTFWGAGVGIRLLGTGFAEVGFGALVKGAAVSTVRGTFTHGSVVAAGRVGSAYITSGLVEAGVGSGLLVPQLIAEANLSSIGAGAGSAGRLGLKDFIPGYGTYSAYQAYRECRGWK